MLLEIYLMIMDSNVFIYFINLIYYVKYNYDTNSTNIILYKSFTLLGVRVKPGCNVGMSGTN